VKELTSKPRVDGKRRVQLWIPDSVYNNFSTALIDEYGHVDFRMSEVSSDLWNDFAKNQGRSLDPDFQIKKKYLIKLKKTIEELSTYGEEINQYKLIELLEETTSCIDERTYRNYTKILRNIKVLEKPKQSGKWGSIDYPINAEKAKQIIEGMKTTQQSKDYQKKKINNGVGIDEKSN